VSGGAARRRPPGSRRAAAAAAGGGLAAAVAGWLALGPATASLPAAATAAAGVGAPGAAAAVSAAGGAAAAGAAGAEDRDPPDLGTRTAGSDWPRFRGALGDGKSPETGLLLNWPPAGPPIVWSSGVARGHSMPAVARGRLFVFDRVGDRERLRCLRSETGGELWSSEYVTTYQGFIERNAGPLAGPLVDHGRVYTYGVEGRLRCHRVVDGELLWEVDTAARFGVVQYFYGAGSSPWIEGDLLLAVVGGSPPGSPEVSSGLVRGNGSGIVAFDKRSGQVRYQITDELASYSGPIAASSGGRRWAFAFTRGGLVGFEPLGGKIDFIFPWKDPTARGINASAPVVAGDTVFISEAYGPGGALLRFAPGAYSVVWQDPSRGAKSLACHFNGPIHHRGFLYGTSGRTSAEAELRCVEHATGKVMWSQPGLELSNLLYVDEHFIVQTEHGRLLAIAARPERFEAVADANLGGGAPRAASTRSAAAAPAPLLRYPAFNAPILSHGLLYARGWDRIVCFDLSPRR
jgi:outer membrane protein assembly factor BamB